MFATIEANFIAHDRCHSSEFRAKSMITRMPLVELLPALTLLAMKQCLLSLPLAAALTLPATAIDDLTDLLEPIRRQHALPALGAAAVVDGELLALGAVGLRKHGGKEPVTTSDKWHIGSCTKSMTATLAASLVEDGKLSWDSTIGDVLGPTLKMRKEYRDVTLRTLLSNRSGIPGKVPPEIWKRTWAGDKRPDIRKQRTAFVKSMLNVAPSFPPGTKYEYSNAGWVTAGAMLEAVTDTSWEDLITRHLFKPLAMTSAGFGSPASPGSEDQPWGHKEPGKPQAPGPGDDNPKVLGPAGTVHLSLTDLARYVRMHALRETGPVLKKQETYDFLHSIAPGNDDYACGWVVAERGWAKGPAFTHNGSNTMNYCVIWFAPKRKFAAIAVTNAGGDGTAKACDAVVAGLVGKYVK